MKDNQMRSTQWKADLTTVTNPNTIGEIRQWLKRNGQPIPSRDADAVANYLHLAVIANNRWGGVSIPLLIRRPRPVLLPEEQGFKTGRGGDGRWALLTRSELTQLAQGACGLLLMLALLVAFAG